MSIKYFISVPNTHDVFVTFTKGVVSLLELVRQPPPTVLHGLGESQQQHQQQLLQGGLPPSAAVTPTTGEHTAVVHLGSNDERSTNTSLDTRPMAATAASALPSRRQPLMPRSMECEDDEEVAAHNSGGVDWGPSGPHALQRMTSLDSMFQFPPTPQLRPVLEDHYNRQASEDAMLLLSESEMLNVSNASMDNNNNIQAMAGGDSGGGEDSPPMPILRPTPGDAPQFGTNHNLLRPRGPAAPHHRHASPTVRPPQLQEHSGNWTNGNPTHTCVPVVRSAVCLPHDVVATCFCPSAPVERRLFAELAEGRQQPPAPGDAVGNSGSDVFVAVGTRSGMLAIVRCGRSASEQLVVARCTPPHVTLRSPSTAGGGDTAGTAGTAGGAGASNTAAGGTGNNTSAFQNYAFEDSEWDSCTTVVWVRAQPIIGVGHASGRIAWYYVEASSSVASPLSATVAPLYGEPRHHDNADAAVTITLTHIATYPAYMSNRMAYVASSNELTQSGMVVFSTQEEVLLFDVRCDASGRSPARPMEPLGSVKQRRSRDAPLDGRAIAFRRNPSSPVAPHHQASSFGGYDPQRLARTVGVLPRGGDYVACHPSLPYFALLGRGKPLHVSESGTMSSNCTPAGALRTTHGAPPAELQSPPVTPATMTPGSAGTGAPSTTPLHLQIFEVRKQVAHACGAARLVRQSIRTDAILDAAWRFSADLTLMVNISDESNLRLYTFSYQQQSTPQSTGGGGGSTANDNAPTSSSLQWGDRIVPFASHGAIVNVEWMSAAASCFNQQHRDVVLAKEGRHYAPGFGEASHVVGVGLRGEIAITTIMPDPAISWCDDHHVVVGTGSTLCIFGTTSACDDMVPAAAAAAAAGRSASGSMVHLAVNDPTSCGVAVETMMLLRSQAGFGIDPRLCEKALRSFRAAVANGGGGRKLPPPTFLEILCRYMTALEQVGVCAAHGRVPGVLQWLSYPHDSVPTHDQLLEAGMYTKDSVFYCPSSLSSTNSYFGGGHHQTTRENDPRRILLLYVFGWIPTPPPNRSPLGAGLGGGTTASTTGSSSSSLSNSSYLRVTAPWLTDIDDVERLAAILVYYGQLQEASAVLHVHHTLQPAFAPIAGLLLTMHTNRCRQQQQQLQMSTLAQQQQSSAPPFASTAGMSDPVTNRVLSALPEGISNAMGPELYAAITDACSGPLPVPVHWGGDLSTISSSCSTTSAGSYDDPSLSMIDRIMIAVLKHPNIAELTETLRTCFLTSNCNPVLRLLLEGIHEGTASLMQRHVDVTADVQLAACLFARMGVLHTAGTAAAGNRSATVPMDGTLASLGQYRPTTSSGSAAVVWSSWAATYRTFLMDRGLFVQRSLFDIHVKRLEASVRGKGPVAMHAPSRCPPGRQPMGSCERQDTTGDDCVCKGRGNTLHMRPAHAATVAAAVRQCSVCGDRLAPGLGGTQAARAHFLQLASATSNMDSDAAATSNRNACRLTMLMRTAFVWCTVCGHGGHVSHLQSWFASHAHCPSSGCSCKCAASQSR